MHALKQYFRSRSGYVRPSRALSLGTAVVALMMVAVVGGFQPAAADYCYNIPPGQYGWVCFPDQTNCPTPGSPDCNRVLYYHQSDPVGCQEVGWGCCEC